MTPLPAPKALENYYLEARARLLDVAAVLDRIDRGENVISVDADPRLERLRQALRILQSRENNRAEQLQNLFSLPYDPAWSRPKPRG